MGRESTDWALDHAIAERAAFAQLELTAWFAFDTLLEVDRVWRKWGPPPMPHPEVEALLAAVRHAITLSPFDGDDMTPGTGAAEGEAVAPVLGLATDVHADDDISGAFADLNLTDDIDGEAA